RGRPRGLPPAAPLEGRHARRRLRSARLHRAARGPARPSPEPATRMPVRPFVQRGWKSGVLRLPEEPELLQDALSRPSPLSTGLRRPRLTAQSAAGSGGVMCLDLLSPVSSDTAPPADAGDEEP